MKRDKEDSVSGTFPSAQSLAILFASVVFPLPGRPSTNANALHSYWLEAFSYSILSLSPNRAYISFSMKTLVYLCCDLLERIKTRSMKVFALARGHESSGTSLIFDKTFLSGR